MHLHIKIGGQTSYIKEKEDKCLTDDQARHVYQKVESGSKINVDTIRQEIDQDVDRIDDTSDEINAYCENILNKAERDKTILSQIKQWSIQSNDRHPKNFYKLDIRAVGHKSHRKICNKGEERQILELDIGDTPEN